MPKNSNFNERAQADTLWITVPGKKHQVPVLMMSDATTRLIAARVLVQGEKSEVLKQLERGWVRFFGPMKILQVDEHRAWSSDAVREWCTEQDAQLVISPGLSSHEIGHLGKTTSSDASSPGVVPQRQSTDRFEFRWTPHAHQLCDPSSESNSECMWVLTDPVDTWVHPSRTRTSHGGAVPQQPSSS